MASLCRGEVASGSTELAWRSEPTSGWVWIQVAWPPDAGPGQAVLHDITERKERDLRSERERCLLRSLVDSIPDLIFFKDRDSRFLGCNQAFTAYTGIPEAELIGKSDRDVATSDYADHFRRSDLEMIETGRSVRIEEWMPFKDGTGRLVETVKTPYRDELGRTIGVLGICRDITARRRAEQALRESEARFRQLVENINEILWLADYTTRQVLYVSPGYRTLTGQEAETEDAWIWRTVLHPDDRALLAPVDWDTLASGRHAPTFRIIRPDGEIRWMREHVRPVPDDSGSRVWRLVGVAEDITEHRRLEEQITRVQRMEALGALVGGLAHDINNLFTPVILSSQLVRPNASAQDARLLDIIEQSAQRGTAIVRQLLAYASRSEGEHKAIDLGSVLQDMLLIMRETFPREIVIETNVQPDLHPVLGDATQLHQVLMNLCVNARDAMPSGGRLIISLQNRRLDENCACIDARARPGRHVLLTVEDSGPGIPPDLRHRIFDPFFTTKPTGQGNGLGLSSVLGIVTAHQGFVIAAGEPGAGARFEVYLPAVNATPAPGHTAAAIPASPATGTLLVVEDEDAIRESLEAVLVNAGHRVLLAANGVEAEALLDGPLGEGVELVITDLRMPVMGGMELIRRLRRSRPELPILPMSGLGLDDNREELARLGLRDCLPKPFTVAEALAHTTRALGRARGETPPS